MKKQPKVINVHVKIMKKKECPKKIVKVKRKRGMGKVPKTKSNWLYK